MNNSNLQFNNEDTINSGNNKLTYLETCAGIGATSLVFKRIAKRLGIELECVGYSEIDKNAIKAYEALHSNAPINYGDITKIDWSKICCDILSLTFPCTDISIAGSGRGFKEDSGTSSSIVWSIKDMFDTIPKKPKIIFMENVNAILFKKHRPTFEKLVAFLEEQGYFVRYAKIDAAKMGVPQHRERVYLIATLGVDLDFSFPKEKPLKTRLCDILEKDVDKKYYLKKLRTYFIKHSLETKYTFRVFNPSCCEIAHTITTCSGTRISDNFIFENDLSTDSKLYIKYKKLEKANVSLRDVKKTRIRKLTPREVMTLTGLTNEEQDKLSFLSDSAIYKLMGNSIVVDVLEEIFYEYFSSYKENIGGKNYE